MKEKTENLGFIVLHIDSNVANNIIKPINELCSKLEKKCVIFNSYNISTEYSLPIMHISQCKFFNGSVMTFDTIGLLLASSCYKLKNIYYYAKDIPWSLDGSVDFSFWSKLFEDDRIKVISQNKEIAHIFTKIWKKPLVISNQICSDEVVKHV